MRLAFALRKFPHEIEAMDADEFLECRLFLSENPPIAYWTVWEMVGKICSTVHNTWSKTYRGPEKFMPKLMPKRPKKDD